MYVYESEKQSYSFPVKWNISVSEAEVEMMKDAMLLY